MASAEVPDDWCPGIIKPIYKDKRGERDPSNYRGISLLSCLGKVFTSYINKRAMCYVEDRKTVEAE